MNDIQVVLFIIRVPTYFASAETFYILQYVNMYSSSLSYSLTVIELEHPELDPPATVEMSMSLIDANNDTCLILEDTDMYSFSPSKSQWVPQPKNACWRSGLVIKTAVPDNIHASFKIILTGHRLVCSHSHLKVMTRHTKLSDCGLVSGKYHICALSGGAETETDGLTTCVAACEYMENKTKYVVIEIPRKHEGWTLCGITIQ